MTFTPLSKICDSKQCFEKHSEVEIVLTCFDVRYIPAPSGCWDVPNHPWKYGERNKGKTESTNIKCLNYDSSKL